MRLILYYFVKLYIKIGLFFYSKKIKVTGRKNVPKNEAVLFLANHPNGLIDPLFVASNTYRKTHFLVRAAVFKKKTVAYIFDLLGMMPIYRIRDGIQQLSKNDAIFNKCYDILGNKKALLIFPEGSHNKKRAIRPLSKGFTRIIIGTLEKYPDIKINLVPVGITHQNVGTYPNKVAINYGKPIIANELYNPTKLNDSIKLLKNEVKNQLEQLSVHIPEENYQETYNKLLKRNVDFTDVTKVNQLITSGFSSKKSSVKNPKSFLYYLIVINSIIPYLLWKKISKKIKEDEFIDTFKFGINIITFPLFYLLQSFVVYKLINYKVAAIYLFFSIVLVLINTKTSTTNAG